MLDHILPALADAQVEHQQTGPIRKELLGITQHVRQMIFPHVRLGERGIDQVIGGGIFPLQKEFGAEGIIFLQVVHLCIGQLQVIHLICKLAIRVISEDQLTNTTGELYVQLIRNSALPLTSPPK